MEGVRSSDMYQEFMRLWKAEGGASREVSEHDVLFFLQNRKKMLSTSYSFLQMEDEPSTES